MRIPIYTSLRELDSAPRRFLLFIVFNVISWQCIVGQVLVLFARHIHMPESLVGFLLGFMPLSMVLVLVTGRIVTRLGPKPVMLTAWGLRNLIACSVFLMPLAMQRWGVEAGWYVLLGATLGFCLMRSIGSGGWLPWLHEVVPVLQRGTYFSSEAAVTNVLNVVLLGGIALMLLGTPSVGRYLSVYAVGIVSGLISLLWMFRVPGGHAIPEVEDATKNDSLRRAIGDRGFLRFVFAASLCFSSFAWFNSVSTLYLRDVLGLEWEVMAIQAMVSLSVLLTIRSWARYADFAGSGRAMALTLLGHAMTTTAFLFLRPESRLTYAALVPVVVAAGVFGTAFWIAVHRAMLNRLEESCRVGYSNVWTVGTNVSMGLTPILAGSAVEHMGMWGYRLCFSIAILSAVGCAAVSLRVVADGRGFVSLRTLLHPMLPLRTLERLTRISLGLHESNR